jgi:transposase InsO family protein
MWDACKMLWSLLVGLFRSRASLEAENLVLRQQIIVLRRTAPKRLRFNVLDRLLFVSLYRMLPDVRHTLAIIKPETVIRWHRAGFRAYWRWRSRSRPGRPKVPAEVRQLIREMGLANPLWGAPRIHGELLKLGIDIGQTSVAKYMARRRRPPSQGWRTFLRNHADGIAAMDLFVVPTISFRCLYGLLIVRHDRRRLLWLGATAHPTGEWIAQQLVEACGWDQPPRYLVRDRDHSYGEVFVRRVRVMGIRDRPTSPRSPWQNGYAERLIGSIRRECLDHVIVFGERHLRHMLRSYLDYYKPSSQHPSVYVVEGKRVCCSGQGPVGCRVRWRARSTIVCAAGASRSERLKIHGPSASGWTASISPPSAASRSVFWLMPRSLAARVRFSQGSTPSAAGRQTGMRW